MPRKRPQTTCLRYPLLLCGSWLALATTCLAGPPLSIDDPDILVPGAWEIIVASSAEHYAAGELLESPIVDVSLGLAANSQVSLSLPYREITSAGGHGVSGLGSASLGFKWRFHAADGWAWAVAPAYSTPVSHEVIARHGPEDVGVLTLPLLVSRQAGAFTVLGQAAWNLDSRGNRHWDYGLALTRPLGASVEAMLEVSGHAEASMHHPTLIYQLGLDLRIRPGLHLLGSVGSAIRSHPEPDARLDYRYFVGLRWLP